MGRQPAPCQHELSTDRLLCQPVKGCQLYLVREGVKNLNPCSLEILGVPRDNREAVHLGGGSDQPVYDGKRLRVLLAPPGGGDGQRYWQDPVRESELHFSQPARKAGCLLVVPAAANT
jgi:hypothetical protein